MSHLQQRATVSDLLRVRSARCIPAPDLGEILLRLPASSFHELKSSFVSVSSTDVFNESVHMSHDSFLFTLRPYILPFLNENLHNTPLTLTLSNLFKLVDKNATGFISFEQFADFIMDVLDNGIASHGSVFASLFSHSTLSPNFLKNPFPLHCSLIGCKFLFRNTVAVITDTSVNLYALPFAELHSYKIEAVSDVVGIESKQNLVCSASWRVFQYDLITRTKLTSYDLPSAVNCLTYISFIDCISCGLADGRIALLLLSSKDVISATLPLLSSRAHTGWVTSVAYVHGSQGMVSGGDDERLFFWSFASISSESFATQSSSVGGLVIKPRLEFVTDGSGVSSIATSSDHVNMVVVGFRSGSIAIYSPYINKSSASVSVPRPVLDVRVSSKGSTIVAVDQSCRVYVIDVKVLRIVQTLGDTSSTLIDAPLKFF
ncbi:hypothetical protein GEMRC1_012891 [Eukaryota sp. GEM-RC1]